MPDHKFGFDTLCLHAGQIPDAATGARAQPIYQTTSFVFDSADHAAALFNLQTFGNVYSRISNPTVAARTLYGGTYSQLAVTFAQFGIDVTFADADDPAAFRAALRTNTKAIYAETIGNPQLNVCDIAALADLAHGAAMSQTLSCGLPIVSA